jgi:hypothetical protein
MRGGSNRDWFFLDLKLDDFTSDSRLHMRIWQEAGKMSPQLAAGSEPELEQVES